MKIGTIILWDNYSIPTGWAVCDGSNGTPDCRNKFIYGCDTNTALGTTGGVISHQHDLNATSTGSQASHSHSTYTGTSSSAYRGNRAHTGNLQGADENHTHPITANFSAEGQHTHDVISPTSSDNLPPHIKLVYIMKIS